MIYKIGLILGLPLVTGFYITKFSGNLWAMPIFYSIVGISYIIFREKLGNIFYEEDIKAKKMSKNVSWSILKNMSNKSIEPISEEKDKKVKDPYIKGAIQFGVWYLVIALTIILWYWFIYWIKS